MAVGFGKNQGFGDFFTTGEDGGQAVSKGFDDGADLIRVDDIAVKLFGAVGFIFVLSFPAFLRSLALAPLDLLLGADGAALGGFSVSITNTSWPTLTPSPRLFVVVFTDHVLAEKPVGTVIRRGGQTHQVGIKIFQHLPPQVVNGAVAFINNDDVKNSGGTLAL